MLINEILTEKIQLKELGPDYSKAKTVTYNKVKYDWDKTTQTYTAPTGQQVPPGGDLYKQLLKTFGIENFAIILAVCQTSLIAKTFIID